MTLCTAMSTAKPRVINEDEIVFQRMKKSAEKAVQTLVSEIVGNFRRVRRLAADIWVWWLYYVFVFKCQLQHVQLHLQETARRYETEIIYDIPATKWFIYYIQSLYNPRRSVECVPCICFKEGRQQENRVIHAYFVESLEVWLLSKGIRVSLNCPSQWNDGSLLLNIIQHISSTNNNRFKSLDPPNAPKNWSLAINLIKSKYPGLINNTLLLHCLTSSKSIHLHHIVEILSSMKHARRRIWRAHLCRWIICAMDAVNGLVEPSCSLSGPGIVYAKLNTRNEIALRTRFPCPSFTVELEHESGEIWREQSNNAKSTSTQEDQCYSNSPGSEPPIEIIRASRSHYRIFYFPRVKGTYKISIKPGPKGAGHIVGSPFHVSAEPATYWRQSLMSDNQRPSRRISSVDRPYIRFSSSTSRRYEDQGEGEFIDEEPEAKLDVNSNGNLVFDDDDVIEKGQDASTHDGKSSRGLRKMTFAVFRQIGTGISTVSSRMFSSISNRGERNHIRSSGASAKRRTYANACAKQTYGITRSVDSGRLSVPSSRNLIIRKVLVHRYLNDAMPSLEEYFFGKGGFKIPCDDSGEGMGASQRWGSISSLLRVKMKMMNKVKNDRVDTNAEILRSNPDVENGRMHRSRLHRSEGAYGNRRISSQKIRRSTGDMFNRRNSGYASSSSSESGFEANDLSPIVDDEKTHETVADDVFPVVAPSDTESSTEQKEEIAKPKFRDVKIPPDHISHNIPRFEHIFDNQSSAADILLQETIPSRLSDSYITNFARRSVGHDRRTSRRRTAHKQTSSDSDSLDSKKPGQEDRTRRSRGLRASSGNEKEAILRFAARLVNLTLIMAAREHANRIKKGDSL